ncbi:hypothetical protein [Streptomyces sp. NPDC052701]|uniref:hypothetical protein n=1 Tax=Streptomyces sp. NPDC052701 TaxID=3155533 RepID=UPI0034368E16
MKTTRPKILLMAGLALALALAAGIAFSFDLPPFKRSGLIRAEDVCPSLGAGSATVSALDEVLPDKSSYSFREDTRDPRTDELDDSYQTSCFVRGDNEQLLFAGTEMLEYDRAGSWMEEAVAQFESAAALKPFAVGDNGVASSRVAAIYLPCTSHGANRHLSVIVRLKKHGNAADSALRNGLITLATNAASYAHAEARCDLPLNMKN